MFRDLSLRYKIPLRGIGVIVTTAIVVTVALTFRAYDDLKQDVLASAESLGRVLAVGLVPEMAHDDVWRAYELVSSPSRAHGAASANQPAFLVVLDTERKIYVSSAADRFPMLADARQINSDFLAIARHIDRGDSLTGSLVEPKDSSHFYVVLPITSEGVNLGHLVIGYASSIFVPRFEEIVKRAGLITLAALAVLVPFAWAWGARMAIPLVELATHMKGAATALPDPASLRPVKARDEIGELGEAFRRMLLELKEKQSLERQVEVANRLAAIGRLSAGIAHEINNPLGGMLNAINTLRRHGSNELLATRTMSLLERGLMQIKETVGALLVEAKVTQHLLTRQDLEDVRTLVQAEVNRKHADLVWRNEIAGEVALPATGVRQILLNLLLNAAHAVEHDASVVCEVKIDNGALRLKVANGGEPIPAEIIPYLFEPFVSGHEAGSGLGLWVTYQIVHQLGGHIQAESRPDETRFTVSLPIAETTP